MVTSIVKYEEQPGVPPLARGLRIESMSDLSAFGAMLAKSGYFKDAREAAQACVKVQAGLELGLPPVQAMTGIHIVEGKPTISATLIATLVKRSGKYNYRVTAHDETRCSIAFFEGKEKIGESTFTFADAEKAGVTKNAIWHKYRRNMLFARAMSNGARWYCPDIFGGVIYTPEELGAEVNEEGEPVKTVVAEAVRPEAPKPAPAVSTDLKAVQDAVWAEFNRLLVGDGMEKADKREARMNVVKRVNRGVEPGTDVETWKAVLAILKEEPMPEQIPDGVEGDPDTNPAVGGER